MMNGIPLPDPLDISDKTNAPEKWSLFKAQWNNYLTLAEACVSSKCSKITSKKVQVALFQSLIGGKTLQLIHKICNDQATLEEIINRLDEYFSNAKNVTFERFVFNSATQLPDESCKGYINRLHEMVGKCEFESLSNLSRLEIEEQLIRDRLVVGLSNNDLRKQLLAKKDLSLDNATTMCLSYEQANNLSCKINECRASSGEPSGENMADESFKVRTDFKLLLCKFCGGKHKRGPSYCPAFGKTCSMCKRKNHFAKMCHQVKQKIKVVGANGDEDVDCQEDDEIYEIKDDIPKKRLFVNLKVLMKGGNKLLKCQLDSGATCNVLSYNILRELLGIDQPVLQSSHTTLTFYGGASKPSLGKITMHVVWKNVKQRITFEVINTQQNPLIGAQDCLRLGLIAVDDGVFELKTSQNPSAILSSFKDVGDGLGCFEGKHNFKLDETVVPVVVPPRRYPLALQDDIRSEIQRLEGLGVIQKVTEPSSWVSAMVVVKKPNKLRICIDPHQLNKAIKRSHYQVPTIEEIAPKLTKARIFSTLDLKDGFWHIQLTEDASKLTTFWTPFGRYRWLRMPFGIKSAPEEFQRRVHEELEGLEGIITIADDVVVYGIGDNDEQALEDHNRKLRALLERARQRNLKFNMNKCKIGLKEVKYMGHVLSNDGLKADPDKILAVTNMKEPQNKEEAQRFLGFINYLSKFLPKLSEEAAPIRALTKEDVKWTWQKLHSSAFKKLVNMVTSSPTLQYFNKEIPVTLQCDASQFGLGASMIQNGRPVAYISRTLNSTECHYAQIEKECLAVLFAFERFDQYLFGKHDVKVETDHKPLETIFKKPLVNAPKRLQRMLLRLQKFTFTVVYRPGKTMLLADFLSRAPIRPDKERNEEDNAVLIFKTSRTNMTSGLEDCKSLEYVNVTDERLTQLKDHTRNDPVLQKLIPVIINGWPNKKTQVAKELWTYWPFKEELAFEDGLILKGERIVVPLSMKIELVRRIHSTHQGAESCLRRAKDVFFWPGMSGDIRNEVERCKLCKKYSQSQQKESLLLQETPSRPWQRIAVDFAQEGSTHYIIVTDYYSSFFEVRKTMKCTSEALITFCKELFARYGIPDIVVGDSGTPILSQVFRDFSEEWKFKIMTSSPYHHQANGKVESAVKIFKNMLKKVREDKGDFQQALLELRNTPLKEIGYSPAQLLMSRRTKSFVPASTDLLRPNIPCRVTESWDKKKAAYKKYYDKGAKDLTPLVKGQCVWVQRKPQERRDPWVEGKVVKKEGDRRYLVEVNGNQLIRNRRFLRT